MKTKQEAWKKFAGSGDVNDYLEFRSLNSKEENRNAPEHRWTGDKGNGDGRK